MLQMLQKNKGECEILEIRISKKMKIFEFPRGHIFSNRCKSKILKFAFEHTAIKSYKLPETVENLYGTFRECENLLKVEFWREPTHLQELKKNTFENCKKSKNLLYQTQ